MLINVKSEDNNGEIPVILSDEHLDHYEYVDMCIGDMEFTVLIEDLYFASKTFYERRNSRLQTDALRYKQNS